MVPVMSLWLPILVAAVLVFIVSALIHMVLPYHRTDFAKLPAEDDVMESLRQARIPPGDYVMPHAPTPKDMQSPGYVEKMEKGPVALLRVLPSGPPAMGKSLALWFVYCVAVGIFAAYVAGRALAPGAEYLQAFRFAGTTAFVGYAVALWQESIWYKRPWSTTLKNTFDGLIYALLTAGAFGWLWPG